MHADLFLDIPIADRHAEGPRGQLIDFVVDAEWASAHRVPGQYCEVRVDGASGYFALASRPGETRFRFYVQDNGGCSTALMIRATGTRVELGLPAGGGYGLEAALAGTGPIHALATGSGWYGVRSALHALADGERGARAFVGFRTAADVLDAPGHAALRARGIDVEVCLSRADADWHGARGYVQQVMSASGDDLSDAWVLACGQPEMLDDARVRCAALGLPPERFLTNY